MLVVQSKIQGSVSRERLFLIRRYFNYPEVFSPVARYDSIGSLLAVTNVCNWDIHQMDVKTAFLQGDLEDEIYMEQPEGFVNKERTDFVWKLKKNIYGLKQAVKLLQLTLSSCLMGTRNAVLIRVFTPSR